MLNHHYFSIIVKKKDLFLKFGNFFFTENKYLLINYHLSPFCESLNVLYNGWSVTPAKHSESKVLDLSLVINRADPRCNKHLGH